MQQALYQVHVLDRTGRPLRVGPKMLKEPAQNFRDAIEKQIRLGREKDWKQPTLVECTKVIQ